MSLYDYKKVTELESHDYSWHTLLMLLMRNADSGNLEKLRGIFPKEWKELWLRYNMPFGILPQDGDFAELYKQAGHEPPTKEHFDTMYKHRAEQFDNNWRF